MRSLEGVGGGGDQEGGGGGGVREGWLLGSVGCSSFIILFNGRFSNIFPLKSILNILHNSTLALKTFQLQYIFNFALLFITKWPPHIVKYFYLKVKTRYHLAIIYINSATSFTLHFYIY